MPSLSGKVAIVTGASRGIGRGIALQLGQAGATVYVTGRRPTDSMSAQDSTLPTLEKTADEVSARGGKGVVAYCDHSNMDDVKALFDRVSEENDGKLDILVNNAYAAVSAISSNMGKKFWDVDPAIWDVVNNVGLRNHYFCSVYAARMMVAKRSGLIINVSSAGGLQYLFNVAYGVGKAANDRMAADMALELRSANVTSISLWPGAVRTELIMKYVDDNKFSPAGELDGDKMKKVFENGETIEYAGKAVVALASDENVFRKTGRVLVTGDLGREYGFLDIDGRSPPSMRSVSSALAFYGYDGMAAWIPDWIRFPGWLLSASTSKL